MKYYEVDRKTPYARGEADYWLRRDYKPHKYYDGSYREPKPNYNLTQAERDDYARGLKKGTDKEIILTSGKNRCFYLNGSI